MDNLKRLDAARSALNAAVDAVLEPPAPTPRRLGHPFWRTPLPADAPVTATSADFVARLVAQYQIGPTTTPLSYGYSAPWNTNTEQGAYSIAVYVLPLDTPRVPVWSEADKGGGLRAVLSAGVPVPDPARMAGGGLAPKGTDGAVIFICGTEAWEMWKFRPRVEADTTVPTTHQWVCRQGGHIRDTATHPGWWAGWSYFGGGKNGHVAGYDWGVSASGMSYLGSTLTAEDYYADTIDHPLALALPVTGGTPNSILPATRYDRQAMVREATPGAANAIRIPEGARFRLPHDFDIAGWVSAHPPRAQSGRQDATAVVLTKVLTCLRDYGVLVTESAGILGFSAEYVETMGTPYSPFSAAQKFKWGNFGQQLPWGKLVQVAPPAVDISVPASG